MALLGSYYFNFTKSQEKLHTHVDAFFHEKAPRWGEYIFYSFLPPYKGQYDSELYRKKKKTTIMEKKTRSEVTVAQKDMVINVGFVNKSDYALSFMFVYDAVGGSNSQELVDLLLKSGSFGYSGSALKLE